MVINGEKTEMPVLKLNDGIETKINENITIKRQKVENNCSI